MRMSQCIIVTAILVISMTLPCVAAESESTDQRLNRLEIAVAQLTTYLKAGDSQTPVDWVSLMTDIEYLKNEVMTLRARLEKNRNETASLEDIGRPVNLSLNPGKQSPDSTAAGSLDNLAISGFVDASAVGQANGNESSFGLDQVEIDVTNSFTDRVEARADVEFMSDGVGGFDLNLEQGFLSYAFGVDRNWTATFGKFNAPIGFEGADPTEMYQYSASTVADYGIPGDLTGFMLHATYGIVDWAAYIANGWDVNADNNRDKTLGIRLGFTPVEAVNFGLSAISGPEYDDNNGTRRTVLDADFTVTPAESFLVGGELNYGIESNLPGSGGDGSWSGALLTTNVGLSERASWTTRVDYFNDKDGLRSGTVQELKSVTVAPLVAIAGGLGGLVELRYDFSNRDVFTDGDGQPTDNQITTAVEFTYGF